MGWRLSKQQVLGVALLSVAVATSVLIPGVGLADDFLIPLALYLIVQKQGRRKKWKRKK